MMSKKISERLFDRLVEMGLKPKTVPQRIMAGYWQRSLGAWRWSCWTEENTEMGSQDTMTECVNAESLSYYRHGLDTIVCVDG